ncbi:hypothetical protein DPMN_036321 [Dreissena polymorpha]|uniref:Uncharacterized protein n=1 Tax=Dreissena polymorpha TaxID=45954 RepID=A0A9D4M981_DREPO|nr:hypothetical protein DPMN_036321 [Dreissena polymorpha]
MWHVSVSPCCYTASRCPRALTCSGRLLRRTSTVMTGRRGLLQLRRPRSWHGSWRATVSYTTRRSRQRWHTSSAS